MKKATVSLLFVIAASFVAAQDQDPGRATANGKFDTGTMSIDYGVPAWSDGHAAAVKDGAIWRLGNNLPTTCTVDCGVMSATGPITPGTYKLALKYVKEGVAHLLFYQGAWLHAEGLPTWEVASASVINDATKTSPKLMIGFEGKTMSVGFGPYAATFAFQTIKTHPPVETNFANVNVKVTTLALPLGEAPVKDLRVGVADIEMNGMKTSWGMYLTMEGEKGTLAFKNSEAATLPKDKATLGGIVTRIKSMIAEKPEMKDRVGSFVTMFEKQISDLEMKEKQISRLSPDKSVDATLSKRESPAGVLQFSHERPEGRIIFKFGAKATDATFDINPRTFNVRRG